MSKGLNLVQWARRSSPWNTISLDQAISMYSQFGFQGLGYGGGLIQTIQNNKETIKTDFAGFIGGAYKSNGIVFACMLTRASLFSEARFQFRRMNNGRPGKLFGTSDLSILETPWPNGTTGDLLTRAITDVDLAGNFYCTRVPDKKLGVRLARLRPDWVTILLGSTEDVNLSQYDPTAELLGYLYQPGGYGSGLAHKFYLPEEVAHWAPVTDPEAHYRGMSWIQPVLNEILGDRAMNTHKQAYFENGAALRSSSKVATPTGWTTMGEIKVGDSVIGQNGKPTTVLGVYPQGEKDFYRVTFTGGVSAECCEDHLWQVQTYADRMGDVHRVMSLRSIMDAGLQYPSGPYKWAIPLTDPVEYEDADLLPLDPYIVGALLGDGYMAKSVEMASHADDADFMADQVWGGLPTTAKVRLELRRRDRGGLTSTIEIRRRPQTTRQNWLGQVLQQMGLRGLTGQQKAVPEAYMRASVQDRIALLQGLVDTDGHVEMGQPGTIRFTNISEKLARQVTELAESLGAVASIKRRVRKMETAQVQWVVSFSRLPEWIVPVRLPRKVETYRLSQRFIDRTRFMKLAEYAGRDQMICIKVESPDGLYLTDDFIVTHNTPNLVVSMETGKMDRRTFQEWIDQFENERSGAINAYKTLYLGQGATAQVVGNNVKDLDYAVVQGHGEPLALDTPIPTPAGWTTMAEVRAGDKVFGRKGDPINVLEVFPVHHDRQCFRVCFSDNTSIVADANHQWTAIDRQMTRKEATYTTEELFLLDNEWREEGKPGNRLGIPAGRPVVLPKLDLLIDPYVLGVWLGDGATAGAAICGVDPDLAFIQAEFERRGYTTNRWSTAPEKIPVFGVPGGLLAALDALGVLGAKRIPEEYLRASISQRLDLLRGLMDTDGSIGHVGNETCEYSSKWEHLARQVAELTRSLGYRSSLNFKTDQRSKTGKTWRLTFRADPDVIPFLLPRKADRCQTPVHVKNRAIISIEPVNSVPVRCIAVDSDDHLFRAGEGWTLTHNTRVAAAAGVPAIVVGFSEGLESATYSNFAQARRVLADKTLRPLWRDFCSSMANIITVPPGSMLWYDDRDIAFLMADAKDNADVQLTQSTAVRLLVDAGYDPDSIVAAITGNDLTLLQHSGLYSVQLQPPNSTPSSPTDPQLPGKGNEPAPALTTGNGNGNGSGDKKSPTSSASLVSSPERLARALIAVSSDS